MGFAQDRDVPTLGELLWKLFVLVNLANPWRRELLQALSTARAAQSFSCSSEDLGLNTQNLLTQVEKRMGFSCMKSSGHNVLYPKAVALRKSSSFSQQQLPRPLAEQQTSLC